MEALRTAPPVATYVSYQYRNRTGVISSISVGLLDSFRTLEMSGRSRDQVEAAASVASSIISQSETTVGGLFQRVIAGSVLLVVGSILLIAPFRRALWPSLALKLAGLFFSLSVWTLPWRGWFPGSAVYRDDASFFVRHAALISFLGFLVTIVALIWSVVRTGATLKAR